MDALKVQLNHYDYLRSNVAFCEELKRNDIEFGTAVYWWYLDAVYEMELAFSIPLSVEDTKGYAARIQRYLAFCEKWTSEHI
jgi:hypothetical protein